MKKWFQDKMYHQEDWDEQEYDQPSPQPHNQRNITSSEDLQTKMYYQYPKRGAFRFPIIPDQQQSQHQRQNRNDSSNWNEEKYQQSSSSRRQQRTRETRDQSYTKEKQRYTYDEQSYTSSSKQQGSSTSSSYDETIPYNTFSPTEVPSPIYGFGKREGKFFETDTEQEPLFLQNQEEKTNDAFIPADGQEEMANEYVDNTKEEHNIVELFPADEESSTSITMEPSEEVATSPIEREASRAEAEVFEEDQGLLHNQEQATSPVAIMMEEESSETPAESNWNLSKETEVDSGCETDIEKEQHEKEAEVQEPQDDLVTDTAEHSQQGEPNEEKEAHNISATYEEAPEEFVWDVPEETELDAKREMVMEEGLYDSQAERGEQDDVEQFTEELDERKELNEDEVDTENSQEPAKPKQHRRPFNVIMTPSDKRNRDRKPAAEQKKTNQTEETNVENTQPMKHSLTPEEEIKEVKQDSRPPVHLLNDAPEKNEHDEEWIEEQKQLLETTLKHFHVKAKVVNAMKGPTVTRFEVQPEPGVKVSKITNLSDDIKLNLAAKDIRMEAPIPGKNAIGIEVPNPSSQAVAFQGILEDEAFAANKSPLSVGLGLDISGMPVVTDIRKMPHGLIAGATGSGKSVCINTILLSLLYKSHYEDVKFLLIDPKMVELAPYNELPHLVAPVITDVKAATSALKWAVKEMENRYEKFVTEGVRDIDRFNEKIISKGRSNEKMPYLVIVIDELADLMMMSPQDVEDAICRIAQKARACGIHLLVATQRPSVDVITGLIKANIPTRIAFSVSSQVDSRTIIDTNGAEKLLGKGDMLFLENGSGKSQRLQGAFVSDEEIERVTNHVKKIAGPQYEFEQEELIQQTDFEEDEDDLFEEAVEFVIQQNGASASLLQRRFKVGYNRAARLIDTMEEKGIISETKGSKPRDVFVTQASFEEMRQNN
ncbi:DNA translocase FtsK [Pontibacillus salicampi]|uniref:DNA translocase FtsK n=1 Tax=Pontibacillus salicampi TaxID=1449801 RepID=A0ABV6LIW5_9BACI